MGIRFLGGFEQSGVLEPVAEPEGAVVVKVVADEHVGRRGLLGNRLQRRVGLEQRHGGRPAGIGNAVDAHAAVIVGGVLQQPLDGVIGVGAFVDGLWIALVSWGALHHEPAFRFEAAAQVLEDEDITVGNELIEIPGFHKGLFVFRDAVRRANHQKGQESGCVLGAEDHGLQAHAVAHWNHDFHAVENGRPGGRGLRRHRGGEQEQKDGRRVEQPEGPLRRSHIEVANSVRHGREVSTAEQGVSTGF